MQTDMTDRILSAKCAADLLKIAAEFDLLITEEQAENYFRRMGSSGELSDDELEDVAGGGCGGKDSEYSDFVRCPACNAAPVIVLGRKPSVNADGEVVYRCPHCSRLFIEKS